MEGLAYIYMALAYEESLTQNISEQFTEEFSDEEWQSVIFDRESSSEDVNKSYSNFCTSEF